MKPLLIRLLWAEALSRASADQMERRPTRRKRETMGAALAATNIANLIFLGLLSLAQSRICSQALNQ
jgi:hypothetical protein